MCRRNLFTAIRTVSSVLLVAIFISYMVLSINQSIKDLTYRSWTFTDNIFRSPQPAVISSTHNKVVHAVTKRAVAQLSSSSPKIKRRLRCPGEIRTKYCVIRNYYCAKMSSGFNKTVTLTTQGTVTFLFHVEELCKRWQGPISVAVYAPGDDFQRAKDEIIRLRNCRNACVGNLVTWHFIFDVEHQPSSNHLLIPKKLKFNSSVLFCKSLNAPKTSYVQSHRLVYPINVARNVARLSARTYYVFASDIELYPSLGIIPRFLKMVARLHSDPKNSFDLSNKKHVFVFRVFEVDEKVKTVPSTKDELVKLYKKHLAIFFHRFMCYRCHNIPNLKEWMKYSSTDDELTISMTTKRQRKYALNDWEPFFIGTNADPLFDERLTWNGKANKMQVALELCLVDYDLHILDDAFMVHIPGIKKFSFAKQKPRVPYMRKNKAIFKAITEELHYKYGNNSECF